MTELGRGGAPLAWGADSGGVQWHVELDRSVLLPGRLVGGRIALLAGRPLQARALVAELVAIEHWRHRVTHHGANGTTRAEACPHCGVRRRRALVAGEPATRACCPWCARLRPSSLGLLG